MIEPLRTLTAFAVGLTELSKCHRHFFRASRRRFLLRHFKASVLMRFRPDKPLTVVGAVAWHQGLLLLTGPNAPGLVAKSISIDSAHNEDDRKSEWSGRAYEEAHRSLAP